MPAIARQSSDGHRAFFPANSLYMVVVMLVRTLWLATGGKTLWPALGGPHVMGAGQD